MRTSPTAFLFNATGEGAPDWYGGLFDPALLKALSDADPAGKTSSWILRGDLLLHNMATKVKAVQRESKSSSFTQGYDYDLLNTIIWDFVDALTGQWNTFSIEILLKALGRHSIHCIVMPTLPIEFRSQLDETLRSLPLYLGAMEIDLGNPIQTQALINFLIKDAAICNGVFWMESDWEGELQSVFEGAADFRPGGLSVAPCGELASMIGPLPQAELSKRGAETMERYQGKRIFTLEERVLEALSRWWETPHSKDFAFQAGGNSSSLFEAVVPPPKFIAYLLNPDHKDNGGKAKFFNEVLGIKSEDWKYLAAQIQEQLSSPDVSDLRIKSWEGGVGASFNLPMTIRGLNDRIVAVDTNWIMEPGQQPRLSTIFPAQERPSEGAAAPPIVPNDLVGDEKWRMLYDFAHKAGEKAILAVVPTPMFIEGFGGVAEGLCGWAYIHVPDARRDFAKWLLKSDHADRGYRGGASIHVSSPTQSVDRAYAYAKAFGRVLEHNGIDCRVEQHLD